MMTWTEDLRQAHSERMKRAWTDPDFARRARMARETWSDEQKKTLVDLWQAGNSAAIIADKIQGKTRNAVIGRLSRLRAAGHILRKDKPNIHLRRPANKALRIRKPRKTREQSPWDRDASEAVSLAGPKLRPLLEPVAPPVVILKPNEKEPDGTPATLMELCSAACKWPVTEQGPHLFCNKIRRGDGPYCDEHTVKSFKPPREMRRGKYEVPFQ